MLADLVQPFLPILPQVYSPDFKCARKCLIRCHVFQLFQPALLDARHPCRGTLMELSIMPIITSRMIMQLLAGANLIDVDSSLMEDCALLSGAQQIFTLIIVLSQATVYMLAGLYGEPSNLEAGACLLLIIKLIVAALIVIIVDELLQKGTAWDRASICSSRPTSRSALTGNVFIVSQMLAIRFPRSLLVKILGVCEVSSIFSFPKDVGILADVLSPFSGYFLHFVPFDLQHLEDCPQLSATGGIAYYMSRPHTIKEPVLDPIHTTIYIAFMLSACALFSKTLIEISGSGPRDVAKQLKDGQVSFAYLCTRDGTLTNGRCMTQSSRQDVLTSAKLTSASLSRHSVDPYRPT
ncbi:hypothetical protein CVT25_001403 [Psilocybe cyanescens]|uniref:Translocon Sec61/SecY plug domain-containing protein n=1 Tax=Psilocybe cyanescens TaxID=93625 RepID=A0A409WNH2_PSICY|nr:hypothetical protein CVT25_001403 [Psilocybe cyanescens]